MPGILQTRNNYLHILLEIMKYYFDIIDLVKFAQRNGSVMGIQRVQIRVLQHLSSTTENDEIFCVYAINRLSGIKVC